MSRLFITMFNVMFDIFKCLHDVRYHFKFTKYGGLLLQGYFFSFTKVSNTIIAINVILIQILMPLLQYIIPVFLLSMGYLVAISSKFFLILTYKGGSFECLMDPNTAGSLVTPPNVPSNIETDFAADTHTHFLLAPP